MFTYYSTRLGMKSACFIPLVTECYISCLCYMLCSVVKLKKAMHADKMEQLAVLSVLRPNKIPTCIKHGRTKRTNVPRPNKNTNIHENTVVLSVLRPNKIPTCIEHGRTKRTNVPRPKKIPTYIEHCRTKRTNVPRPKKIQTYIEHGRTKRTNVLRPKK